MRRFVFACLASLCFLACGGDADGGGTPADAGPDAGALPLCTGAVYDSCADEAGSTDCGDGLQCHYYGTAGITVCVPACDDDNPCPDQNGAEIRCNNMGRCRPDVANECMLP